TKTTEGLSPSLGSGKGSTGPLRNHPGFVFSHRCKDMNGKAVRLREIDGLEFDPGVHEVRNEGDVTGQPIELGNDQGGFMNAASRQSFGELRSIATTAAFDLRELRERFFAL